MEENDLLNKPCQIYNIDETGMPLNPSSPLVVTTKRQKHPQTIMTGNKSQITDLQFMTQLEFPLRNDA